MTYTFAYGLMIKMHESMFAIIIYSLLLQYTLLTFSNALAICCYLFMLFFTIYVVKIYTEIYCKMNSIAQKSQLWIANHFTPLVQRQGFINLNKEKTFNFDLKKNFHLINYSKKITVAICIFFGNDSPNFQLASIIFIYSASLIFVLYLRPYRSHFYTVLKVL